MRDLVLEQLRHLAGNLSVLQGRVRQAVAGEVARAVAETVGEVIDTIMSGIIYLWQEGNWDLAIIVFIASMVVPIGKLLALSWLALSVRFGPPRQRQARTRMYRAVEFIGRWSMLDIFVAGLLTALVNFNALLMVRVLPGAVAFAAVVVLTMLAAFSFDPRLIWDTRRYDD